MKVLLVDDDVEERDLTAFVLRRHGFEVVEAPNHTQALRRFRVERPDLVALSLNLPGSSGVELLRQIRAERATPVIVTVSPDDGENILRSFELGADDFITRPFTSHELALRVRAIVGRSSRSGGVPEPATPLEVGDLRLDPETHLATRGAIEVRLTPTEFRICCALAKNAGRVVTASRLRALVGGTADGAANSLRSHISHLRTKLALSGGLDGSIVNVTAVGYVLHAPSGVQAGVVN